MIPEAKGQGLQVSTRLLRAAVNGLWRGNKMRVIGVDE